MQERLRTGFSRFFDLFEAVPGLEVDRRNGGAFVRRAAQAGQR